MLRSEAIGDDPAAAQDGWIAPVAGVAAVGDDGTGNPFCIAEDGGDRVEYWSKIDGETTWLADNFDAFLVGSLKGTITT